MATESSSVVPTDIERKIIRQVEYYFSDTNLPKDKFLQEEVKKDDGWVPIQTLTTFNRMKSLSTDIEAISAALKKSSIGIVEVNDDNTKVRRNKSKPLPENRLEFWRQLKERTLYLKGFPLDTELDQIMEFLEKHGKVENVIMRRLRDEKRTFKGSIFATFATLDTCKAILELESLKFNDTELIKMFESAYHNKKNEERQQNKLARKQGNVAAKEHEKNKHHQKQGSGGKDEKKEDESFTPGLVIHVTGLAEVKDPNRDDIKATFQKHGIVEWVDFNRGDKEAWIRIKGEENEAENVLKKVTSEKEGKFVYKEVELSLTVLAGEEEKAYWIKTRKDRREALNRKSQGKRHNKFSGKKDRNRERSHKNKEERVKETENGTKKEKVENNGTSKEEGSSSTTTKETVVKEVNMEETAKSGVKRPASDEKNGVNKPDHVDSPASKIAKVDTE